MGDNKAKCLTSVDAKIILSLAKNELRLKAVADELHYSRNSVEYHIERIKSVTGRNPRGFFDLQELIPTAKTILEGGWEWFDDKWRCGYCKTSLVDILMGMWDDPTAKPKLNYCPECGKDMRGKEDG